MQTKINATEATAAFTFYKPETASEPAKRLLLAIQEQYGFIPNLFAYMAEAPTTIEAYLALNEILARTSLTPAQRQVALLAVSAQNHCNFCTTAHRALGTIEGVNEQTLAAISQECSASDPTCSLDELQNLALASFAQEVTNSRGKPSEIETQNFLDAGFNRQQILEVILIISIKTLSNYINHLTQPEPNEELLKMLKK